MTSRPTRLPSESPYVPTADPTSDDQLRSQLNTNGNTTTLVTVAIAVLSTMAFFVCLSFVQFARKNLGIKSYKNNSKILAATGRRRKTTMEPSAPVFEASLPAASLRASAPANCENINTQDILPTIEEEAAVEEDEIPNPPHTTKAMAMQYLADEMYEISSDSSEDSSASSYSSGDSSDIRQTIEEEAAVEEEIPNPPHTTEAMTMGYLADDMYEISSDSSEDSGRDSWAQGG